MRTGTLKHRVQLERRQNVQDAAGQQVPTWVLVEEVWADVLFPNGIETMRADAPVAIKRASVRIRYRTDVQPATWRLIFEGEVFGITAALPDLRRKEHLDLVAETGQNDG